MFSFHSRTRTPHPSQLASASAGVHSVQDFTQISRVNKAEIALLARETYIVASESAAGQDSPESSVPPCRLRFAYFCGRLSCRPHIPLSPRRPAFRGICCHRVCLPLPHHPCERSISKGGAVRIRTLRQNTQMHSLSCPGSTWGGKSLPSLTTFRKHCIRRSLERESMKARRWCCVRQHTHTHTKHTHTCSPCCLHPHISICRSPLCCCCRTRSARSLASRL